MKVDFSREQKFVPEFKGNREQAEPEQCFANIKVMRTGDLLRLLNKLQEVGKVTDAGTQIAEKQENFDAKALGDLLDACGDLLPQYVDLQNLEDNTGAVTVEDTINNIFYLELAVELLMALADMSMPNEAEEKNLSAQPG